MKKRKIKEENVVIVEMNNINVKFLRIQIPSYTIDINVKKIIIEIPPYTTLIQQIYETSALITITSLFTKYPILIKMGKCPIGIKYKYRLLKLYYCSIGGRNMRIRQVFILTSKNYNLRKITKLLPELKK